MDYPAYRYLVPLLFLGACNGLIFTALLFRHRRGDQRSNRILAILVLIMSLSLAESVLVLSGGFREWPQLISVTFPLQFLLGPLFYFYVQVRLRQVLAFRPVHLLHLIPFLIAICDHIPVYGMPDPELIVHLDTILSQGNMQVNPRLFAMMAFKILQLGIYLFLAYRSLATFERDIRKFRSDEAALTQRWIKTLSFWFTGYVGLHLVVFTSFAAFQAYSVFIDSLIFLGKSLFVLAVAFHAIRVPEIYSGPSSKVACGRNTGTRRFLPAIAGNMYKSSPP